MLSVLIALLALLLVAGGEIVIIASGGASAPASTANKYSLAEQVGDFTLSLVPDPAPAWNTYPAVLPKDTATFATFSGLYGEASGPTVGVDGIYAVSKGTAVAKLTDDPGSLAVKSLNTIDLSITTPDQYPTGSSTADLECVRNFGHVDCVWADNSVEYIFEFANYPDEDQAAAEAKAIAQAVKH